jgi:hypothetical protein
MSDAGADGGTRTAPFPAQRAEVGGKNGERASSNGWCSIAVISLVRLSCWPWVLTHPLGAGADESSCHVPLFTGIGESSTNRKNGQQSRSRRAMKKIGVAVPAR